MSDSTTSQSNSTLSLWDDQNISPAEYLEKVKTRLDYIDFHLLDSQRRAQMGLSPGRVKWHIRLLQQARFVARFSKDPSTQVGAVIARHDFLHHGTRTVGTAILGLGYNGFPRNVPDTEDALNDRPTKYAATVHAEINAKDDAGKKLDGTVGLTLYTWPFSSCVNCLPQMLSIGVRTFIAPVPSEDAWSRWSESLRQGGALLQRTRESDSPATLHLYSDVAIDDEILFRHGSYNF